MRQPSKTTTGRSWILLLIGIILGAVLSAVYLRKPPFVTYVNNKTTDAVMAQAPGEPASDSVVIVDLDEKSLAQYGQWPWSRSLLAQLLDAIAASGAATIALDLILAEPDRTSLTAHQVDHDARLAETLARGPYVLGYAFSFRNGPKSPPRSTLHPPGVVWVNIRDRAPDRIPVFTARSVTCNLPSFSNAVRRSGFLNATPDGDGILRRVPALIRFEDTFYPSFALATLMQYAKTDQMEIVWREASDRLDLQAGKRVIPVDGNGNLLVKFSRAGVTPHISASDVLMGKHAVDFFRGKIVVVGASAAGLEPTYTTPGGELHTPAEVQAHVLENLLAGQRAIRTGKFPLFEVLIGMAVAAGTALAVAALRILPGAGLCAALTAGTWLAMELVFRRSGYLFSPLLPTVLVLVNFAVLTIVKAYRSLAEKQLLLEKINLSLEQRVAEAVSEARSKDQLLIQQGRQAAMGEMISNIAHQWRQPLNMLGLIIQELRLIYGRPEFNKETLDDSVASAMKVIRHMSQTIEDFRNYFKPDKEKTPFLASQAVQRTLALVGATLSAQEIEVEVRENDHSEIYGYPNEYSQVLLNILLNCRDAFEASSVKRRRTIAIEVGRVAGKSVVTITDNAGGIPEEIIGKIFDPYFTTKGPDKGTGVGLYMAKSIIEKNMGGRLEVRNTGEGAEFRIEV